MHRSNSMASESDTEIFVRTWVEHQGGVLGGGGPSFARGSEQESRSVEPVRRYELRSAGCDVHDDVTRALHRGDAGGARRGAPGAGTERAEYLREVDRLMDDVQRARTQVQRETLNSRQTSMTREQLHPPGPRIGDEPYNNSGRREFSDGLLEADGRRPRLKSSESFGTVTPKPGHVATRVNNDCQVTRPIVGLGCELYDEHRADSIEPTRASANAQFSDNINLV